VPIPTFQKSSDVSGLVDLHIAKVSIIKISGLLSRIPYSSEQGISEQEQGNFEEEQGIPISLVKVKIIAACGFQAYASQSTPANLDVWPGKISNATFILRNQTATSAAAP